MKPWKFVLSGLLGVAVIGCGEPTYDIPEVDAEETKKKEEEIKKGVEEEMKRQMMQGGGAG